MNLEDYKLPKFVDELKARLHSGELNENQYVVLLLEDKRLSFEQRVSILDLYRAVWT